MLPVLFGIKRYSEKFGAGERIVKCEKDLTATKIQPNLESSEINKKLKVFILKNKQTVFVRLHTKKGGCV